MLKIPAGGNVDRNGPGLPGIHLATKMAASAGRRGSASDNVCMNTMEKSDFIGFRDKEMKKGMKRVEKMEETRSGFEKNCKWIQENKGKKMKR